MLNKLFKRTFGCLAVIVSVVALASCGPKEKDPKEHTYNTYTTVSPSNWNELTYQDNNDTQIMSYIGSAFFSYDFKYDANGAIVPGEFEMEYSAATNLEDVSAQYAGAEKGWGIPEGASARAYKITLRDDLKWDDGTPIKAEDFVYTMKEQLDPLAKHYRADSFYVGGTIIHNAQDYVFQGETAQTSVSTYMSKKGYASIAEFVAAEPDAVTYINWNYSFGAKYEDGKWVAPEDAIVNSNLGLADMYELFCYAVIELLGGDQATADAYFLDEVYLDYAFPAMDFSEVGIFVGATEYEIVIILDKPLELLKEDGSLDYKAAYNFSSLPLVHKEKWEANKVAPSAGSTLWTSKYNSSVDTTASWGPYKLVYFQTDKEYTLERNPYWYGYNMEQYEGQYQTDRIICETIATWQTAWQKFLAGEIDGIGIDVSVANDYKNSERAFFTPDDFVGSLQLQSSYESLKARQDSENAGGANINKTILSYSDFRKALSLGINRSEYARDCTTSSMAGFGLYNSMHYYDVANGGVYRNTDHAKKVLCNVYNVDYTQYNSLDEAVATITGYDPTGAKALIESAYQQALADGEITASQTVKLVFGTGAINESVQRQFDYIKNAWIELVKGTSLEGRLEMEIKDFSTAWSNDFRAGAYDVCMGGWTGAAWDPGYFLLAYLSPAYMYSAAWDTSAQMMTFTMDLGAEGESEEDITDTMSLIAWYNCLNGAASAKYDFSSAALEEEDRLQLIAALEEQVLLAYYTVPLVNSYGASLISWKVDYVTYEYNTFMGYGGIRYMTYNYTDMEWLDYVDENNGEINYK